MDSNTLCAFDADHQRFASVTKDNRLKLWNVVTGKVLHEFHDPQHLSVTYTALSWQHPQYIALGTSKGHIIVWDVAKGVVLESWKEKENVHQGPVTSIVCSRGVSLFSCGEDRHLYEWNIQTAEMIHKYKKDHNSITSLALSADNTMLASASTNIRIWDLSSRKCLRKFTGHSQSVRALAFSRDGRYLLSSATSERFVYLWIAKPANENEEANESAHRVFSCETAMATSLSFNINLDSNKTFHILACTDVGGLLVWKFDANTTKQSKKPAQPSASVASNVLFGAFVSTDHVVAVTSSFIKPSFQKMRYVSSDTGEIVPITIDTTQATNAASAFITKSTPTTSTRGERAAAASINVVGAADMRLPESTHSKLVGVGASGEELQLPSTSDSRTDDTDAKKKRSKGVAVPKADSLQSVLVQALHTHDTPLLESCLAVTDSTIINNTVQRLPTSFVLPFLKQVIEKFQAKPTRGLSLIVWIRALLVQHTSYLMTVPDLVKSLSVLYLTVDSRVNVFKKLLKLSGRLDLLLSQINVGKGVVESGPLLTYEEDSDEDDNDDDDEDDDEELDSSDNEFDDENDDDDDDDDDDEDDDDDDEMDD